MIDCFRVVRAHFMLSIHSSSSPYSHILLANVVPYHVARNYLGMNDYHRDMNSNWSIDNFHSENNEMRLHCALALTGI